MNLSRLLAAVAEPDRPALILPGRGETMITFHQLDLFSSRLAAGLRALGVRRGDRAVVLAPISINLYASLIALFKLGAAAVFLDPSAGMRDFDRAARSSGARVLIAARKTAWLGLVSPALRSFPIRLSTDGGGPGSICDLANAISGLVETAQVEPDCPALITFTGGSVTGTKRGIVRTHGLLVAQHAALARAFPAQPDDRDLPAFPVATLHNLASGVTSVIPDYPFRRPAAVRPERILRQIREHRLTTASGSPAYWRPICEYCLAHDLNLPLRRILIGGAAVHPGLIEVLYRAAPRAEIFCVYGSSEAEPVAVISGDEVLREIAEPSAAGAGLPLGRPVPAISVRVLGESGQELPTGSAGEIWVRGVHVANGALPDLASGRGEEVHAAGGRAWHAMGDVGSMDQDGGLWLLGRLHNTLQVNGQSVYPVPVEVAAESLPFVQRAALVGIPGTQPGMKAALVVELARDAPIPRDWRSRLLALCAERGWPVDQVRAHRRLPVDVRHNARIDYAALRASLRRSR